MEAQIPSPAVNDEREKGAPTLLAGFLVFQLLGSFLAIEGRPDVRERGGCISVMNAEINKCILVCFTKQSSNHHHHQCLHIIVLAKYSLLSITTYYLHILLHPTPTRA